MEVYDHSSLFTSSLIRWLWGFYMYMSMGYTNIQGDLICTFADFNFVCNFCNQFLKQEPHEFLGTMKQEGTLLLKGKKHWQSSSLDFYQICFCSFLLWYWGFCTSAGLREGTQVFKGMKSSLEFLLLIEFNHCSVLVLYLLYP